MRSLGQDNVQVETKTAYRHATLLAVAVGGLMVSVLASEPKVHGFRPGRRQRILRAIEIRSTTSFVGKVKPSVPFRKILQHVKEPYEYEICKISSSHGGEYEVQNCLLGCTAV
jgi:hypothetical protein